MIVVLLRSERLRLAERSHSQLAARDAGGRQRRGDQASASSRRPRRRMSPRAREQGAAAGTSGRARDAGRCAADGDLRSLGTFQPLHLSIQRALRRSDFPSGSRTATGACRRRCAPACTISSATSPRSTASSITRCKGVWAAVYDSLGRFVINSTVGIGGLFDVATSCGCPKTTDGLWDDAVEVGHASGSLPGHSAVRSFDLA